MEESIVRYLGGSPIVRLLTLIWKFVNILSELQMDCETGHLFAKSLLILPQQIIFLPVSLFIFSTDLPGTDAGGRLSGLSYIANIFKTLQLKWMFSNSLVRWWILVMLHIFIRRLIISCFSSLQLYLITGQILSLDFFLLITVKYLIMKPHMSHVSSPSMEGFFRDPCSLHDFSPFWIIWSQWPLWCSPLVQIIYEQIEYHCSQFWKTGTLSLLPYIVREGCFDLSSVFYCLTKAVGNHTDPWQSPETKVL